MPDGKEETAEPDPMDAERRLLEAAVAEARASGGGTPHAIVRRRMLEMIAEARRAKAARVAASK